MPVRDDGVDCYMKKLDHRLRIIGGKWRGRKISFAASKDDDIRPTPGRVRETLFSWLGDFGSASRCLDLYAGSGALSLEALSRGACHVTLIESDTKIARALRDTFTHLCDDASLYQIHKTTAKEWLVACEESYDLIFLDPPFASAELKEVCQMIDKRNLAKGFIYIEAATAMKAQTLPEGWSIYRQKQAGGVHYCLCDARTLA